VSVAFLDKDCPPATVYAAYNNLAAEDVRISHMIGFPHGIRTDVFRQLEKWRKDLR
jgi:cephalosporin-C deacetylase-like acetyl esterase